MNDAIYRKKMIAFNRELNRVSSADPFDSDAYNNLIEARDIATRHWHRSQRSRRSFFEVLIWILFGVLTGLVWRICF